MAAETVRIEIPIETIDETQKGLNSAIKGLKQLEQAYNSLTTTSSKAQSSVSKFDQQAQKTERSLKSWAKEKYQIMLEAKDRISPVLNTIGGGLRSFAGKTWSVTMKAIDLVTAPIRGIFNLLSNPIMQAGAVLGVSIGLTDTINTFKDFEAAMSQVGAISGAMGSDFDALTAKAKEMGATTKFTATEAAEAFNYMAMAGWKTGDMLEGIQPILNLAAASGADLGTTSDIVTDALTAFGYSAKDAGRFADVLAAASSNANTNVTMMGETFKYAGAMAGTLGYSIEDVALMTGLMANAGIKSTMAGTALNMMFTRLSTNTGEARDAIEALGIKFYDQAGNARDLSDVMGELRLATAGMNDEQKSTLANTVAGTQAQKGLLAILNASESDYRKLQDSIEDCDGAAQRMSDRMLDNLAGSLTLLQSAADGAKLALGERLAPYIRSFANWLTDQMPTISTHIERFMDGFDQKVDEFKTKLSEIMSSTEWNNAGLFGKGKILWEEFIGKPLEEWWETKGRAKMAKLAKDMGEGIGTGLKVGILTLLGIDYSGVLDEGTSIGASFAKGFADGFDFDLIKDKIWEGLGNLFKEAGKLLPGGESAGLSSLLSAGLLVKLFSPLVSAGIGTARLGNAIFGAGPNGSASVASMLFGSAAANTGLIGLGQNIAIDLGAGNLAGGGSLSAGALGGVGLASGAGGIIGGVSLISAELDLFRTLQAKNEEEKAALLKSAAWKGGGVAAGAAAGAAIGSFATPIGTAAGALIGAGIGGIIGMIQGDKAKKEYEVEMAKKLAEETEEAQKAALKMEKSFTTIGRTSEDISWGSQLLADAFNSSDISAEKFAEIFEVERLEQAAKAFGTIHLELEDIQKLANQKVFGEMADEFEELAYATQEAETSLNSLEEIRKKLNRENIKIGLGLDYTSEDYENYKEYVDQYIESAKDYIENSRLEAVIAMDLLMGENAPAVPVSNAYTKIQGRLAELENELSGQFEILLDVNTELDAKIDAQKAIEDLQEQIADITDEVTSARTEAEFDALKIKFTGGELDYESFTQMQQELVSKMNAAQLQYDDALTLTIGNLKLAYSEGIIPNMDMLQELINQATESYYANIDALNVRVESFNLEAISEAWGEALNAANPEIKGKTTEWLKNTMDDVVTAHPDVKGWTEADVISWFGLDKMDATKGNEVAKELIMTAMALPEGSKEQIIQSYKDNVPTAEEIKNAIDWEGMSTNTWEGMQKMLGIYEGTGENLWSPGHDGNTTWAELYGDNVESMADEFSQLIHDTLVDKQDPEMMQSFIDQYLSLEGVDYSAFKEDLSTKTATAVSEADRQPTYDSFLEYYNDITNYGSETFAEGLEATYPVNLTIAYNVTDPGLALGGTKYSLTGNGTGTGTPNYWNGGYTLPIPGKASGGFISGGPQLSWLAEEGWGEYVIPTNPSRRSDALDLWMQAGRQLGVGEHFAGGLVGASMDEGNNFSTEPVTNAARGYTKATEGYYEATTPTQGGTERVGKVDLNLSVNPTFNIDGSGNKSEEDIVAIIRRNISKMTDDFSNEISNKLLDAFQNMPMTE